MPSTNEAIAPRVGIALSGGGAFGAWEVGALRAFFGWWKEKFGVPPPIDVVSGTSTGALIAPFALLEGTDGHDYLGELEDWYTSVSEGEIRAPDLLGLFSPAFFFLSCFPAVYRAGYSDDASEAKYLYLQLLERLTAARVEKLGELWPSRRLAIATVDFVYGRSRVFTNDPKTFALRNGVASLQKGIFGSTMAPLALPPAPIESGAEVHPYFDGGVCSEAPIAELFSTAAKETRIDLTHVVVITSFPVWPSNDDSPVQKSPPFPKEPKFGDTGERMNVLMSEASATKDVALGKAAIELRRRGASAVEVEAMTGLPIPGPPPALVSLSPSSRLGWHAFNFNHSEMVAMVERGRLEARKALDKWPL